MRVSVATLPLGGTMLGTCARCWPIPPPPDDDPVVRWILAVEAVEEDGPAAEEELVAAPSLK